MSNRKGQNSIIFLTTLGVYLGLVLIGATPQVIAAQRAAMTRNFDIRDEIEFKDDLDNKPDGERSELSDSVRVYLEDVEQLISALNAFSRKGKFDLSSNPFEVAQTVSLPCTAANIAGSYTAEKFTNSNSAIRSALERFSKQLAYGYSLGDCLVNAKFPGKDAVESHFVFKLDNSAFSVEIVIKKDSRNSAQLLAGSLGKAFQLFRPNDSAALRQKIIAGTTFHSDNDQVFIVTRLPRAGLDSLLAQDAK
jgi:hypothetical protein